MAQTTVKAEIAVSADKLWALVRDFGNVPWIPGGDEATVEGEGVGMVRVLMGGALRERLESIDEGGKQIGYTIDEGLPVPAKDYHATMVVSAAGAESAQLVWSCTYEPDGASEAEVGAQFEGLYDAMIGWIKENLGVA
ncbi:MAG: SRPBCC family protein [Candidatus Binatia bacterium]|nr:SRPBCC family protein [Candidatus Binatia bacterium]